MGSGLPSQRYDEATSYILLYGGSFLLLLEMKETFSTDLRERHGAVTIDHIKHAHLPAPLTIRSLPRDGVPLLKALVWRKFGFSGLHRILPSMPPTLHEP